MAATKIFPITATEYKAIAYIANPEKTDGGRLIYTYGCSDEPSQASLDFDEVRLMGTGQSTVLSQHFIQSFAPGEITPEKALEVGVELADKLLHGEYQYFLAVHTDTNHIHVHCIFNNTNQFSGRTFETLENRKSNPSAAKLLRFSDEICRKHHLSVIEDHRSTKGMSHYEWSMEQINLSWKAKLKHTIDQVVKVSEDFNDFLQKCADFGVLVEHNPNHKIDLKFMLAEQKKRNPRAKMTRARTLGWNYETKQITERIEKMKFYADYTPRIKIIRTASEKFLQSKGLTNWADRQNMKEASKAMNDLAKHGMTADEVHQAAQIAFVHRMELMDELKFINVQLKEIDEQTALITQLQKYKPIHDRLKTLTGKAQKKFLDDCRYELDEYRKAAKKLKTWYTDGVLPTLDLLERKKTALIQERSEKDMQFKAADEESKSLSKSAHTLEKFLENSQERSEEEQRRKKKKNGDLE